MEKFTQPVKKLNSTPMTANTICQQQKTVFVTKNEADAYFLCLFDLDYILNILSVTSFSSFVLYHKGFESEPPRLT